MIPKFSIIIPVYNVAPYLRECLDSVIVAAENLSRVERGEQVEVICVDDGSTDGSGAILDEYSGRARIIHQPNKGVSAARNTALKLACGEWLWFIDGDDLIHSDSLRVVASYIDAYPTVDLIKIKNILAETAPNSWGRDELHPPRILTMKNEQLLNAFDGASRFIIRRSIVRDVVFEPYRWLEDILFVVCSIGNARDLLLTLDVFYFYRKRAGSAIHSRRTVEQVEETFRATERLIDAAMNVMARHPKADYSAYWKLLHALAFFSFRKEYFDLSAHDRGHLFRMWTTLQTKFVGRYAIPLEWRIRIKLARIVHSGLLVKPIVLWGHLWRGKVSRFLSGLKGLLK